MRKVIGIVAVLSLCGVASAGLINGNFESGLTGWTITPTANGRTLIQTTAMYDIDGPGPKGPSMAGKFQVGQVTFTPGVHEGIEVWQTVSVATGDKFSLDCSADRSGGGGNASGGKFTLFVGTATIGIWDSGGISGGTKEYGSIAGTYTGGPGNLKVGVRITRPYIPAGALYQWIDNFVPEPTSLVLLALGGLAALRRR